MTLGGMKLKDPNTIEEVSSDGSSVTPQNSRNHHLQYPHVQQLGLTKPNTKFQTGATSPVRFSNNISESSESESVLDQSEIQTFKTDLVC